MGDFNYPDVDWSRNMVNPSANAECIKFFDCLEDCFYSQHVLNGTRSNSILDLVLSREPDLVSNVEVIDNLGNSNHNMIKYTVHQVCKVQDSRIRQCNYFKGDYTKINSYLSMVDWNSLMSGSVHESWCQFKQIVLSLEQEYIPLKTSIRKEDPKWMTHKALKLVKRKKSLYTI